MNLFLEDLRKSLFFSSILINGTNTIIEPNNLSSVVWKGERLDSWRTILERIAAITAQQIEENAILDIKLNNRNVISTGCSVIYSIKGMNHLKNKDNLANVLSNIWSYMGKFLIAPILLMIGYSYPAQAGYAYLGVNIVN